MRIVSIGEVLWDVIGDKEYLGGAALNFAAHAARLGHTVFFVSAVGKDERGRRVLERMAEIGLSTRYVREVPTHPTGVVTVELDPAGVPRFTLHHPAAYDAPELNEGDVRELLSPQPDWIYFGTLFQMSPQARQLTLRLIDSHCGARLLYDVNLRKDHYTAPLVRELMARAQVTKLNEDEAATIDRCSAGAHVRWKISAAPILGSSAGKPPASRAAKRAARCSCMGSMWKPAAIRCKLRTRWGQATPSPQHSSTV